MFFTGTVEITRNSGTFPGFGCEVEVASQAWITERDSEGHCERNPETLDIEKDGDENDDREIDHEHRQKMRCELSPLTCHTLRRDGAPIKPLDTPIVHEIPPQLSYNGRHTVVW